MPLPAWSRRLISELDNADRRVERLATSVNRAELESHAGRVEHRPVPATPSHRQ